LNKSVRVIGIDPGFAIVGFGVLDFDGYRFSAVEYGAVVTKPDAPFADRLEIIWDELSKVLKKHKPSSMGIEKLFFTTNHKTAIDVSQARGIIVLCAKKHGVDVSEYTPLQVKQAVTGYGKAEKQQVMQMVKTMLKLDKLPKPDDVADAVAVAICHAHSAGRGANILKMR